MWLPKRGKEMLWFFSLTSFQSSGHFLCLVVTGKAKFYRILMDSAISCLSSYIFVRHNSCYGLLKPFRLGKENLLEKQNEPQLEIIWLYIVLLIKLCGCTR